MNIGDKVRFRLQPSGLGALCIVTHKIGREIVVRTVPEGRYVSVWEGDLNTGWGNSDDRSEGNH